MDYYQELLKSLGKAEDVEYLFRTQRSDNPKYPGSFYAQHANNSTSGFREPSNEAGKGYKLQPKSYRTLYLDPRATDAVHSWLRDQNIATYAVPEAGKDGKPTGHLLIKSAEQQKHGKNTLSKDQTLTRVPYSKEPVVGYHPLEFGPSAASPRGSSGDVHYGNKITEVHPRPSRLGKAGIAATLLGGAGAASAAGVCGGGACDPGGGSHDGGESGCAGGMCGGVSAPCAGARGEEVGAPAVHGEGDEDVAPGGSAGC